jgi:hypothetical protein
MASEVGICNQAMSWLGGNLIISLGDDTNEARLCNANYADIRDAVIEANDWTFAITRRDLPMSSVSPVNGYANAFPIPSDILRVTDVNDGQDWRIEGDSIVTNEGSCKIRAVARITDPNRFSTLFRQTLAARIAADLAIPLTQSRALQEQYFKIYMGKLESAIANDGMQGKTRRITSSWLRGSRSGGANLAGPYVGSSSNVIPKG